MKIRQYEFVRVCEIRPKRESDGSVTALRPQARYNNKKKLPLNRYGKGPFSRFTIPKVYKVSGVYAIVVNEELKYIGECVNLSYRFNMGYGNISPRNCFKGGQETNCRINNLIYETAKKGESIFLWFLNTQDHKSVEDDLLMGKSPDWNRA